MTSERPTWRTCSVITKVFNDDDDDDDDDDDHL